MREKPFDRKKYIWGIGLFVLGLFLCFGGKHNLVYGADGTVYTVTVHPVYEHPVTGEIEDSGGSSAKATGQAMVESCVSTTGLLQVTDDGKYYVTIRMSLIDYTSDQKFQVQDWGDSDWTDPNLGITGTGTDSNGTTDDITIQVPSENSILRISMYVTQMGRNVIFYVYTSDASEGNTTDMTATIVTSDSEESEAADTTEVSQAEASTTTETAQRTERSMSESSSENDGLTLSTQTESADATTLDSTRTIGQEIFIRVVSGTIVGLILLCVSFGMVYWLRVHWVYLGGYETEDFGYEKKKAKERDNEA